MFNNKNRQAQLRFYFSCLIKENYQFSKIRDNNEKLILEINTDKVNDLIKKNIISGGMIPKIRNCLDVASNGVKGVCIIDGRLDHSILFELLSNTGSGTLIRE